jgi:serine/threonine protein phosphatase 1
MLKKLFRTNNPPAKGPDGKRVYAVGDIHGRLDLLNELMELVRADAKATSAAPQLVFLGDYVDRGPDSKGVLDRLIEIGQERPDAVFLKGNHEEAMLAFLTDPREYEDWLGWGGAETLESYGVSSPWTRECGDIAADLADRLPKSHVEFLESLKLTHTLGDYIFVHAGLKPGVALDAQEEDDLLWIRSEFHNMRRSQRPDKIVVHGHHAHSKPVDKGWRVCVDSGACFTGRLTALVIEGDGRRFLST